MGEVCEQGVAPRRLVDRVPDMAVEVAIGALADAERPMDIERKVVIRRLGGVHFALDSNAGHESRAPYRRDAGDASRSHGHAAARRVAVERSTPAARRCVAAFGNAARPQRGAAAIWRRTAGLG